MAIDQLGIGIIAEMKQFEESLATIPGIGAKEARDMVRGMQRELRTLDRSVQSSAKNVSSGFSGELNKVSSATAALASKLGGPFAELASVANSTVRPIAEVAAGLGEVGLAAGAVAGVGLVFAGMGVAADKLAEGAVAAAKSLKDMGIGVDDDARADLASYTRGQRDLTTAIDKLEVSLGKGLARDLGAVDDELARGVGIVDRYALQSGNVNDNISLGEDILNKFAHKLGYTHTAIDQASESTHLFNMAQGAMTDIVQDQIATQPAVDAAFSQNAKSQNAVNQVTHDGVLAQGELAQATKEWALQDMLATAAGVVAADKRLETIHAEELAHKESLENAAKYWDDYSKQVHRDAGLVTETVESEAKKQSKAQLKATRDAMEAAGQAVANIAGSYADLEGSIVDGYQARVDAGEKLSVAQVTQANRAINAAEEAQIAQAGITAAITAATGIATLQEAGVPPFAAVPLGLAEGAGLFAATVAGIRQHRPIDFAYNAGGDSPDTTFGGSKKRGAAIVDAKGGDSSQITDPGDDAGVGMHQHQGGGSNARVRHGGVTVDVAVSGGRPGKRPHRGGRA